jgi:hypothetical protein
MIRALRFDPTARSLPPVRNASTRNTAGGEAGLSKRGGYSAKWPLAAAALIVFSGAALAAPSVVKVQKKADGTYTLLRDGQPFFINGVGGASHLEELKQLGGNSFRTWGIEQMEQKQPDGKTLIEKAGELGLGVTVGIWIGHERHGFDYSDQTKIDKQRATVLEAVNKYKDNPAVLIWGLGNEMEGPIGEGKDVRIWKELNELADIIHKEDPNHPVMTVIAGAAEGKVKGVMANYPNIDILGVNAYASATGVGADLKRYGWKKPFILTEFGPSGQWETPKTSWGAPIEPNAQEKAGAYYSTARTVIDDGKGTCLGTYAFLWGNKQEVTSTWYGMFLSSGEKLPTVDAISYIWTGKFPPNRCPKIKSFTSPVALKSVAAGTSNTARIDVTDPESDPLSYEWSIVSESKDLKTGGDAESVPPSHPECIESGTGADLTFKAPATAGGYRIFVVVRDGKGNATTGNLPFQVK